MTAKRHMPNISIDDDRLTAWEMTTEP